MPCRDDNYDSPAPSLVEAALCACLVIDPSLIDKINYESAGISKAALQQWWVQHLKVDAERFQKLLDEKARQKLLLSMTQKERKLLGLSEPMSVKDLRVLLRMPGASKEALVAALNSTEF